MIRVSGIRPLSSQFMIVLIMHGSRPGVPYSTRNKINQTHFRNEPILPRRDAKVSGTAHHRTRHLHILSSISLDPVRHDRASKGRSPRDAADYDAPPSPLLL